MALEWLKDVLPEEKEKRLKEHVARLKKEIAEQQKEIEEQEKEIGEKKKQIDEKKKEMQQAEILTQTAIQESKVIEEMRKTTVEDRLKAEDAQEGLESKAAEAKTREKRERDYGKETTYQNVDIYKNPDIYQEKIPQRVMEKKVTEKEEYVKTEIEKMQETYK